ncbi:HPP family protein [Vibrio sonorensis]|uniref:HPP family protein n=1 Tax=Vibrio sonorensis TaxID=1004316 RepID=UPI0008D9157B|nr:HPP family protein [Vibrio sonorensis]
MKEIWGPTIAGVATAVVIGILAWLDQINGQLALIMAPFGASAVLIFGLPESPLAKAKNVIGGHFVTAFIGVLFTEYLTVSPITLALATGLAVTTMLVTKTTHPPAGANPMVIMLSGQSWLFILFPVLVGAMTLVAGGKVCRLLSNQLKTKSAN